MQIKHRLSVKYSHENNKCLFCCSEFISGRYDGINIKRHIQLRLHVKFPLALWGSLLQNLPIYSQFVHMRIGFFPNGYFNRQVSLKTYITQYTIWLVTRNTMRRDCVCGVAKKGNYLSGSVQWFRSVIYIRPAVNSY